MTESPTDAELFSQLQDGDLDALGSLYERYRPLVYRTALSITHDPEVAEDITQDCFLRLFKYADRFDIDRPLKPWLYRVTANLSYTWVTRRYRWEAPQEGVLEWARTPKEHSPEWQTEIRDIQSRVRDVVGSLSFGQYMVIVLYYLYSLSLQEIAGLLNCPVGTVKSRLYYGRENLYRQVKAGGRVTSEMLNAFA